MLGFILGVLLTIAARYVYDNWDWIRKEMQ